MMRLFSIEFWIVLHLFIELILVVIVWALVRKLKKTYSHPAWKKGFFNDMAASIYDETLSKLEHETDALADKSAVQMVDRAAQDIIELLDPLVKGAESAASSFDSQIKEKKRLIHELNESLDSRIISINLLLSRAEVLLNGQERFRYPRSDGASSNLPSDGVSSKLPSSGNIGFSGVQSISGLKERDFAMRQTSMGNPFEDDVFDQQRKIVELYQRGMDAGEIASKLSMPQGEVQLVINLKEKFIKMENQF
ncbi:MAG: hypothetical protein HQK66_00920 [Desulfamplus sp.]|nr:hypothetical protein [Desulfamplus sp.]